MQRSLQSSALSMFSADRPPVALRCSVPGSGCAPYSLAALAGIIIIMFMILKI